MVNFDTIKRLAHELFIEGNAAEAVIAKLQGDEETLKRLEEAPDDKSALDIISAVTPLVGKTKVAGGLVRAIVKTPTMTKNMLKDMVSDYVLKTGFPYDKVYRMAQGKTIGKGLGKLIEETTEQATKEIATKGFIETYKKGLVGSAIIGADLMFNWFMNDNVPFMTKTYVQKIADGVKWNGDDPDVALENIKRAESMMNVAKWNGYTAWRNPVMWPFFMFYIQANKLQRENITLLKKDVEDASLKKKEGLPPEENDLQKLYTDALVGETDLLTRAKIIEKIERLEEEEIKKGGMKGIMLTGEEDPERRKGVMLAESERKAKLEREREEKSKVSRTRPQGGGFKQTQGTPQERQSKSSLGFGI
jgi:hypothetical protein